MSPASYRTAPPRITMLAEEPRAANPVTGIGDRPRQNAAPPLRRNSEASGLSARMLRSLMPPIFVMHSALRPSTDPVATTFVPRGGTVTAVVATYEATRDAAADALR